MTLFQTRSLDDHTDSLANYLPGGAMFQAKFMEGKRLRRYLRSIAAELSRYHSLLEEVANEHYIRNTQNLINEWESALGIPGTCFDNNGTIEERRRNVLIKLTQLHGSTAEDFVNLAKLLGYTVLVEPARYRAMFPMSFPLYFYSGGKRVQFTLIVTLPPEEEGEHFVFTFPISFTKPENALLQCIFGRMKPANVQLDYRFAELAPSVGRPPDPPQVATNVLLLENDFKFLLEYNETSYLLLEGDTHPSPGSSTDPILNEDGTDLLLEDGLTPLLLE